MSETRLIEQMEVQETRERALCGWRSTPMVDVSGVVQRLIDDDMERKKFRLSITASCDFWCRFGEYQEALLHAKMGMVRHLHAPLFGITDRMRRAVYKADERELLRLIDDLEAEMGMALPTPSARRPGRT